jgi:hypothetical protein
MNDRRKSLSIAAVLAATVLTGGAAILGMNHTTAVAQPAPAAIAQTPQQATPPTWEEGD